MPVYQITATTCGVSTTYRAPGASREHAIANWRRDHPLAQATTLDARRIDPETMMTEENAS